MSDTSNSTATEDSTLFWQLLEGERDRLWQLARGITRSYDDACDLVSDTTVAAFRSFPQLRERRAFRKFLTTIAVRTYKRKLWRTRLFRPIEDIDLFSSEHIGYEYTAESSHDLDLLKRMLERLPARQRETLLLFEISQLSLLEIQAIQGGTVSGVKSRLVRARQTLKRLLTDSPATLAANDIRGLSQKLGLDLGRS